MARTQAANFEQRREAIVEKAAHLFAAQGFASASVAALAQACSTSKSLIYHYYPSKEDVLYAVMSSHIDLLLADVRQVLAGRGEPADRLQALLQAFMGHYAGAADRQKVLLNELDSLPPAQRTEIVHKQRQIVEAMQALLVALDPSLSADPARARAKTMLLFGMINWTHTWYDPAGPIAPAQIADMALDMIQAS